MDGRRDRSLSAKTLGILVLAAALAVSACGRSRSGGGGGGFGGNATPPTGWEELFKAPSPERGFFTLHAAHNGELWAGTYGSPQVFASRTGNKGSWNSISQRIDRAGESVFDLTIFEGTTFAAVESNARVYRYMGGGVWEHVFRAHQQGQGSNWNNAYSIVGCGGWLYTGINEFPGNQRTMFWRGQNVKGEHSPGSQKWEIVKGLHHVHVGCLAGDQLYFNARYASKSGISVARMAPDMKSYREIASLPGNHPSRMRQIGDALYFAVEGTGKVYRVRGDEVKEIATIGETGLMGRVTEHNGGLYVIAGAGWKRTDRPASLWCLNCGGVKKVAEFNEPEGWDALSWNGKLYIVTRHKDGGGRIYRSL